MTRSHSQPLALDRHDERRAEQTRRATNGARVEHAPRAPALWHECNGNSTMLTLAECVRFDVRGGLVHDPRAPHFEVVPLAHVDAAVAALLVPDALAGAVALDGVPLFPGLALLGHADRLDFVGAVAWISAERPHESVAYDPDRHGRDALCARTMARLAAGEPIVVCGGVGAHPCGLLFKRAAWLPGLACHQCGADPARESWAPPRPRERRRKIDELLRICRHGR